MKSSVQSSVQVVQDLLSEGKADDHVHLTYEDRFLRRKRLTSDGGLPFLIDFERATELPDGGLLLLENEKRIAVVAAPEELIEIRGADLPRLAWHIGNRHTPCEIHTDHLRIRQDHVLEAMLNGLGAQLSNVAAPFRPEGGAYGKGRTFGHDHGHAHG